MNNGNNSDSDVEDMGFLSNLAMSLYQRLRGPDDSEGPDWGGSEEEVRSPSPNFSPRLELFVGNLPHNVDSHDLLCCLSNTSAAFGRLVDVNQIIKPMRGRPFAFVRCSTYDKYQEVLGGVYTLGGRVLRIARSTRNNAPEIEDRDLIDLEYDDEPSFFSTAPTTPPPCVGEAPKNPSSAKASMRKASQNELTKLELEFQKMFESTQDRLVDIRRELTAKEREKRELEQKVAQTNARLAKLEFEMDLVGKEEKRTQDEFSRYMDEHSAKIESVRARIDEFRKGQSSKNASAAGSSASASALPDEIRDNLDCICCFETMGEDGASIFQCSEGHLICHLCHNRLTKCPVCRVPYRRPGIRNRMAESLAAHVFKD